MPRNQTPSLPELIETLRRVFGSVSTPPSSVYQEAKRGLTPEALRIFSSGGANIKAPKTAPPPIPEVLTETALGNIVNPEALSEALRAVLEAGPPSPRLAGSYVPFSERPESQPLKLFSNRGARITEAPRSSPPLVPDVLSEAAAGNIANPAALAQALSSAIGGGQQPLNLSDKQRLLEFLGMHATAPTSRQDLLEQLTFSPPVTPLSSRRISLGGTADEQRIVAPEAAAAPKKGPQERGVLRRPAPAEEKRTRKEAVAPAGRGRFGDLMSYLADLRRRELEAATTQRTERGLERASDLLGRGAIQWLQGVPQKITEVPAVNLPGLERERVVEELGVGMQLEARDPESEYSKAYQQVAQSLIPTPAWSKLSASQIESTFPLVGQVVRQQLLERQFRWQEGRRLRQILVSESSKFQTQGKVYRDALEDAENLLANLDANQLGAQAAKRIAARLIGREVGVLTDQDVAAFGELPGISGKYQSIKSFLESRASKEWKEQVRALADEMVVRIKRNWKKAAQDSADRIGRLTEGALDEEQIWGALGVPEGVSGVPLKTVYAVTPGGEFRQYDTTEEAQKALDAGEIQSFVTR